MNIKRGKITLEALQINGHSDCEAMGAGELLEYMEETDGRI